MNTEAAISTLIKYYGVSDSVLIEAINAVVWDINFLTADQTQCVFDALWQIAWDRKFIKGAHNLTNPGYLADKHKGKFLRENTNMRGAFRALASFGVPT